MSGTAKTLIRVAVAIFGALFGSLAASVQICTSALHRAVWPHWADFVCGHNVGFFWLFSAPILFVLVSLLLSARFRSMRVYVVVLLLAAFGINGLLKTLVGAYSWWWIELPVAALGGAIGIALRKGWARYCVYTLALVFAITWVYSIWRAIDSGYYHEIGPAQSMLSLLPGLAFALLAAFCGYVVTYQLKSNDTSKS